MKTITVHKVSIQFDADEITAGAPEEQALQAVQKINSVLQRQPFGLNAQIYAARDEIEVEMEAGAGICTICTACGGKGWIICEVGDHEIPRPEIQRCDTCEKYTNDAVALRAVAEAADKQFSQENK